MPGFGDTAEYLSMWESIRRGKVHPLCYVLTAFAFMIMTFFT